MYRVSLLSKSQESNDYALKHIEKEKEKFIKLKEGISWLNAMNIFFTYFVGKPLHCTNLSIYLKSFVHKIC